MITVATVAVMLGLACGSGPTVTPAVPTSLPTPVNRTQCDPSYPTVCIAPSPPDLDCAQVPHRRFLVLRSDPHGFDRDLDGVGCEWD